MTCPIGTPNAGNNGHMGKNLIIACMNLASSEWIRNLTTTRMLFRGFLFNYDRMHISKQSINRCTVVRLSAIAMLCTAFVCERSQCEARFVAHTEQLGLRTSERFWAYSDIRFDNSVEYRRCSDFDGKRLSTCQLSVSFAVGTNPRICAHFTEMCQLFVIA